MTGDRIRYAQCWEDADVLLGGLAIQPGDRCLAIASAGDNALAMLTRDPACVVAIDLSAAQLACLALRAAAYRRLTHGELLELVGSRPSDRRLALYACCRPALSGEVRAFWDARPVLVKRGIGAAGRFERFFCAFRRWMLPLAHPRRRVQRMLAGGPEAERRHFYENVWCNRRWQWLLRVAASKMALRQGRDAAFFAHVEGGTAGQIAARVQHALVALDPAENPYLHWILTGRHGVALPLALRPEHFETIRVRLDRLSWHRASLEDFLAAQPDDAFDRFNLSDVFEYVSEAQYRTWLEALIRVGRPGGRMAYWNLFVPRTRPDALANSLRPLYVLSNELHAQDKAFFYNRFVVEELC